MRSPTDILVWPDCTMCYAEDLASHADKSDDYRTIMDPHAIGLHNEAAEHLYMYFWSYFNDCNTRPYAFDPNYQGEHA